MFWFANYEKIGSWTRWWLNQPIWIICSSNWIISPNRSEHFNNIWNHHLVNFWYSNTITNKDIFRPFYSFPTKCCNVVWQLLPTIIQVDFPVQGPKACTGPRNWCSKTFQKWLQRFCYFHTSNGRFATLLFVSFCADVLERMKTWWPEAKDASCELSLYNGCLIGILIKWLIISSPHNRVGFHPRLLTLNNEGFFIAEVNTFHLSKSTQVGREPQGPDSSQDFY